MTNGLFVTLNLFQGLLIDFEMLNMALSIKKTQTLWPGLKV